MIIIKRMIKALLNIPELLSYSEEIMSCKKCGNCFLYDWTIADDLYMKVVGNKDRCYCIPCFLRKAKKKKIKISYKKDIKLC